MTIREIFEAIVLACVIGSPFIVEIIKEALA